MAGQDAQPFHWHYPDLDDKNFELRGHSLLLLLVAFAIILFFSLLCLYARWWALGRPTRPVPQATGLTGPNSGRTGLDPGLIGSLPVLLHTQAEVSGEEEEESMCSICLSIFVDDEKVKMLPNCQHVFHPECVDEWLRTRSSCPMCRADIGQLQKVEIDGESPV